MKNNSFLMRKNDLLKLKSLCSCFDEIVNIVCPVSIDNPDECISAIDKIQTKLQKFGEKYGL